MRPRRRAARIRRRRRRRPRGRRETRGTRGVPRPRPRRRRRRPPAPRSGCRPVWVCRSASPRRPASGSPWRSRRWRGRRPATTVEEAASVTVGDHAEGALLVDDEIVLVEDLVLVAGGGDPDRHLGSLEVRVPGDVLVDDRLKREVVVQVDVDRRPADDGVDRPHLDRRHPRSLRLRPGRRGRVPVGPVLGRRPVPAAVPEPAAAGQPGGDGDGHSPGELAP